MARKKNPFLYEGTVTKNDIVDTLFKEIGFSKKHFGEVIEFCFDTIKNKLVSNNNVKISGFGHFILLDKNAKMGRDLTTGEKIHIPSRRVVTFRVSLSFREKIQKYLMN